MSRAVLLWRFLYEKWKNSMKHVDNENTRKAKPENNRLCDRRLSVGRAKTLEYIKVSDNVNNYSCDLETSPYRGQGLHPPSYTDKIKSSFKKSPTEKRKKSPSTKANQVLPTVCDVERMSGSYTSSFYNTPSTCPDEKSSKMASPLSNKEDSGSKWDLTRGRFSRWSRRRSSIKDRPVTGVEAVQSARRRGAMRQRSMSLDAAEDLWSTSAKNSEFSHPTVSPTSTSPNLRESSSKRLMKRSHKFGSIYKNKKNIASGFESDINKEKQKRFPANLQALFDAVEDGDIVRVKDILSDNDACDFDINSINADNLTCLDTSMLTSHSSIARLLIMNGAKENPKLHEYPGFLENHILSLYNEAAQHVADLRVTLNSHLAASNICTSQQKENEKLLIHWQLRKNLFSQMRNVLHISDPPGEPDNVVLSVSGQTSIVISFLESDDTSGSLATRYKVEWSNSDLFDKICGCEIISDPDQTLSTKARFAYKYEISNLITGRAYYVRVSAESFSGISQAVASTPPYGKPSNWKEIFEVKPQYEEKLQVLDQLFDKLKEFRLPDAPEIMSEQIKEKAPAHTRKLTVKKSLKYIFSASPKFQRAVRRGVYLAALICCEDRVLVTNEDTIPVVEVHEDFTLNSILTDYYWLIKIACTWKDIKTLRIDLEKSSSSGSMQFRYRLLQAIVHLQSAIGLQDLGQFYHQPIRDKSGGIVLTIVNQLKSMKSIGSNQYVRWVHISKINRTSRSCDLLPSPETSALDIVVDSVNDLLSYHRTSSQPIGRGLYVAYLRLYSSMELIQITTSQQIPNVLPHKKVRDCPNVTSDEWKWLKDLGQSSLNSKQEQVNLSDSQNIFKQSLTLASIQLLGELGESELEGHKFYDAEVIEISADVSFILILPRQHTVCTLPGQAEETSTACFMLPVQVFEMIHMRTYQYDFINRYARLSSLLEIDIHLAQQALRQAFSTEEMEEARARLDQLNSFHHKLDETWRSVRWTMDVIGYARERYSKCGVPLTQLFDQQSLTEYIQAYSLLSKREKSDSRSSIFSLEYSEHDATDSCGTCEDLTDTLEVYMDNRLFDTSVTTEEALSDAENNSASEDSPLSRCNSSCAKKKYNPKNIYSESDVTLDAVLLEKSLNKNHQGPQNGAVMEELNDKSSQILNTKPCSCCDKESDYARVSRNSSNRNVNLQFTRVYRVMEFVRNKLEPNATVKDIIDILYNKFFTNSDDMLQPVQKKGIKVSELCLVNKSALRQIPLNENLIVTDLAFDKLELRLLSSIS